MKWPTTKQTANAGMIYVQSVINAHGSIYHPVHQESDIGIDGFIELIKTGESSGRLIAIQVKSGDSYVSRNGSGFHVTVDQAHVDYWLSYMVPVILICYAPTNNVSAWVSIRDYVEAWQDQEKGEFKAIDVPEYYPFNVEGLGTRIANLAYARADERLLLQCADKCFSSNPQERRDGFDILQAHPDSRELRITAFLARRLILDSNENTAKDALYSLGYGVGRYRWSFNPSSKFEAEIADFTSEICADLSSQEIRRLIELCDEGPFNGPFGLGERCFDVLCCCYDRAVPILEEFVDNESLPIERRANALIMLNYGSLDELLDAAEIIMNQETLRKVMIWIFGSEEEIHNLRS